MENKFTAGQWKRGTNTASKEWMQIFCSGKIIAEAVPLNRKGCRQPNDFTEEEANAKLIAAAPELYRENKELKEMVKELCGIITSNCDWTKFNKQEFEIMESANAILTAIKSATE